MGSKGTVAVALLEVCAGMWKLFFIPWLVAAPSGNPCHPHFNEMSVLHFTTTHEEQFIELSVREECYNAEEMKNLKLNSYGILVVNTKSSLMGDERNYADPERSFSAANRLSREERSNIKTESLDNIMTVQRNGPSILTVKLQQLALQWMHPAPGLGLDPGMPSNLAREGSLMKAVRENIAKDAYELAKLHVRRHMVVHGLNARKDTEEIKNRLLQEELAKMNIFSIGSSEKTD
ncbi:unnamed protein product [Cylicocyclus nassatus]|uniref:Uncharacterized protein n=1 Tax=Cylicocyclus nassatus TaxID=53992 RepID=A0AA36DNY7_CYLNA|nr:unnamed protein product [Cylicocyclus nassatus]